MSFLNSVLSNIGNEGQRTPTVLPPLQYKRKAEEDLISPSGKAAKPSNGVRSNLVSNLKTQDKSGAINGTSKQPNSLVVPYRGTGKCAPSSAPTTPTTEPGKQPKKGSFKEIMARAKAAKEQEQKKPAIGTIVHKPRDKVDLTLKKELQVKKRALRNKKLGKARDGSRPRSSDGSRIGGTAPDGKANEKKVPQPAYSGMAQANPKPKPKPQPAYKGTMGARPPPGKPTEKAKPKPRRNANEYAGTDDELDSEGEDDGVRYGYSDEESDDMEAGFSDVDEEETRAAQIARKEDEEELKRENQKKKEKMEKKARMDALAKKAKPQRY